MEATPAARVFDEQRTEAAIAGCIGRHCAELAEMARNAKFHSLLDLLVRAQIEAELWARAVEDR